LVDNPMPSPDIQ